MLRGARSSLGAPGTVFAVLQNVSTIANLYSQAAFVLVENDSTDNTHEILRKWLSKRECSHLICLNELAAQETRRTARLAIPRNSYMEVVLQSRKLAQFDHLVVLDFDDVNASVISEESLKGSDYIFEQPQAECCGLCKPIALL